MEQNDRIAHTPAICHDHANELRRMARKIGHPAGDVPSVMRAAADRIDELERLVAAFQRACGSRGLDHGTRPERT